MTPGIHLIAFILFLLAAFSFGIAAWVTKSLIALGLCVLTVGFIVQFGTLTHTIHF